MFLVSWVILWLLACALQLMVYVLLKISSAGLDCGVCTSICVYERDKKTFCGWKREMPWKCWPEEDSCESALEWKSLNVIRNLSELCTYHFLIYNTGGTTPYFIGRSTATLLCIFLISAGTVVNSTVAKQTAGKWLKSTRWEHSDNKLPELLYYICKMHAAFHELGTNPMLLIYVR